MAIPKKATEVYVAALGNGNVSGGGPYDSAGNRAAGAIEYRLYPSNGDFKFTPTRPAPVREMHNGRFTGRTTPGDDAVKSASISLAMRTHEIRDFLLGRHATAVSTISDSETSDSPSDCDFHFWIKRVTRKLDGTDRIEIIGHCYCNPDQAQGEHETLTVNVEVMPPEFVTEYDGFIYIIN